MGFHRPPKNACPAEENQAPVALLQTDKVIRVSFGDACAHISGYAARRGLRAVPRSQHGSAPRAD